MKRFNPPSTGRGMAAIEYIVVVSLVSLVLFSGNPSPAQQVAMAMGQFYQSLTFVISLP